MNTPADDRPQAVAQGKAAKGPEGTSRDPSDSRMALAVYVLYCAGFLFYLPAIIGVVIAHVSIGTAPDWLQGHYRHQIRTFWIGFILFVIGVPLSFVLIGWFVLLFWFIWTLVRSVKGLKLLNQGEPYPSN